MKIEHPRATEKQVHFLDTLFIDLEFNRITRNAWLTDLFNREIKYLDELFRHEASEAIDKLLELKENR